MTGSTDKMFHPLIKGHLSIRSVVDHTFLKLHCVTVYKLCSDPGG